MLATLFSMLMFVSLALCDNTVVVLDSKVTKAEPRVLHCGNVDSLEESDTLIWTYTNSTGNNMTLDTTDLALNISDNSATGYYVCEVNGEEMASYLAAKLVEAVIVNARKSLTYNDGDTNRKITCAVDGSFPPPQFTWKRQDVSDGDAPILLSSINTGNFYVNTTGERSILFFYNITYDDQANYICDVINAAGNNTVEIMIRVKDKYAALWPFMGIVIEVVVLIAIIFLYERHSKKVAENEDNIQQPEDEKPLKSEEGTELRNRNGGKQTEKI